MMKPIKELEARKMIFNAAIQLTAGVLANPASIPTHGDVQAIRRLVTTSVSVAKQILDDSGIQVDA